MSRPRSKIRTASPILRTIFEALETNIGAYRDFEKSQGWAHSRMSYWRSGKATPNIITVETLALAAGYRLVLEKISEE